MKTLNPPPPIKPAKPRFAADRAPELVPAGVVTGILVAWETIETEAGPGVRWWFGFKCPLFEHLRLPYVTGLTWRPNNRLGQLAQCLDVPAPEQTFPDLDPDELIGCSCLVEVEHYHARPFGDVEARLTPHRAVQGGGLSFRRNQRTPPAEPEIPLWYRKFTGRA